MKLAFLLATALLAAAPAFAQPAADVPEALLDELLSSLPHQEEWAASTDPDPADLARIEALNPGREKEVRPILADHARCLAPALTAATRRGLRTMGARLGADKVRRIIAFYRSDDVRRMEAIEAFEQKGSKITPAQEAELARIRATYPVMAEFVQGIQKTGEIVAADSAFMSEAGRCAAARLAALERAKLKSP